MVSKNRCLLQIVMQKTTIFISVYTSMCKHISNLNYKNIFMLRKNRIRAFQGTEPPYMNPVLCGTQHYFEPKLNLIKKAY